MITEVAFLQQIHEQPEDTPTRLIYADWLEEQGDSRAELIRVEAEMASLPVYSDRYVELKACRNQLRPQFDSAWLQQMGYVPTHRPLFTQLPQQRAHRWRLVGEFIELWHGSLKRKDGYSQTELAAAEKKLGFKLPVAVREWYALAGNRRDVWCNQDRLYSLSQLKLDNERDMLPIWCENQGCEQWGIRVKDLGKDDPPIYRLYESARISSSTTAFAVQVLLYELKFAKTVIMGWGTCPQKVFDDEIKEKYRKCKLSCNYWHNALFRLYEGKDTVIEAIENERSLEMGPEIWVSTRTEEAYAQVSEAIRQHLERL